MTAPLWQWNALELAGAIARREVSATEVVGSVVDRVRAANPGLNAIVDDLGDAALEQSRAADDALARGVAIGPLHGVPVTVKINTDLTGRPTDNGMPALSELIAPGDAPVVARLKESGAIVIGRTNAPELSMRATTDNPLYGRTVNPWDAVATPGGSSGGAGAAAAAGFGPIHQGNDIGGSLRLPAFANGVTTIKPTQGRVAAFNPSSTAERGVLATLMSTQGVIGRSVDDVAFVTRLISKGDPRDPWWVPAVWDGPRPSVPVRVAVTRNGHGYPVHAGIVDCIDRAAGALSDAGYDVVEAEPPPITEAVRGWFSGGVTEIKLTLDPLVRSFGSADLQRIFDAYYDEGDLLDLAGYRASMSDRTRMLREWGLFLETHPLVLTPYLLRPTFPWDHDAKGVDELRDMLGAMAYSLGLNFLGLPAGVVPVGFAGGLPAGVQVVGGRYREDLVLEAMLAIESRVGRLIDELWAREG